MMYTLRIYRHTILQCTIHIIFIIIDGLSINNIDLNYFSVLTSPNKLYYVFFL